MIRGNRAADAANDLPAVSFQGTNDNGDFSETEKMHGSSTFLFPFVILKVIIAQGRVNVTGNFTYLVTSAQQLRIM